MVIKCKNCKIYREYCFNHPTEYNNFQCEFFSDYFNDECSFYKEGRSELDMAIENVEGSQIAYKNLILKAMKEYRENQHGEK